MRFKEIYQTLKEHGLKHNYSSVSNNLKYLASLGKIVKYEWNNNPRYGIPDTKDGTRYIVVKNKGLPDEIIELE